MIYCKLIKIISQDQLQREELCQDRIFLVNFYQELIQLRLTILTRSYRRLFKLRIRKSIRRSKRTRKEEMSSCSQSINSMPCKLLIIKRRSSRRKFKYFQPQNKSLHLHLFQLRNSKNCHLVIMR
jgi:hypothetical protein